MHEKFTFHSIPVYVGITKFGAVKITTHKLKEATTLKIPPNSKLS